MSIADRTSLTPAILLSLLLPRLSFLCDILVTHNPHNFKWSHSARWLCLVPARRNFCLLNLDRRTYRVLTVQIAFLLTSIWCNPSTINLVNICTWISWWIRESREVIRNIKLITKQTTWVSRILKLWWEVFLRMANTRIWLYLVMGVTSKSTELLSALSHTFLTRLWKAAFR